VTRPSRPGPAAPPLHAPISIGSNSGNRRWTSSVRRAQRREAIRALLASPRGRTVATTPRSPGTNAIDHVFGRNPRMAAAPDHEEMGFPRGRTRLASEAFDWWCFFEYNQGLHFPGFRHRDVSFQSGGNLSPSRGLGELRRRVVHEPRVSEVRCGKANHPWSLIHAHRPPVYCGRGPGVGPSPEA
jgi:hypothetical protein